MHNIVIFSRDASADTHAVFCNKKNLARMLAICCSKMRASQLGGTGGQVDTKRDTVWIKIATFSATPVD